MHGAHTAWKALSKARVRMNGSRPEARSKAMADSSAATGNLSFGSRSRKPPMRRGNPRARRAQPERRTTNGPSVVLVLDLFGVGVSVEQLIEFTTIADAHGEDPALAEGILVDGLGLVVEQFVDLDDLAGNRRIDVRGGLHRLDHRHAGAGLYARADLRQLHVDQVAELALRMVGDAHADDAVVFDAGPLVGFEELQIAGNLAHGRVQSFVRGMERRF